MAWGAHFTERASFYLREGQLELARRDGHRALELFAECGAKHHQAGVSKFLELLPA